MELGLKGKRALVIGASQGLGKAIAQALIAEDCMVAIASRNKDSLQETAEEILLDHPQGEIFVHPVDVTDSSSINHLVNAVKGEFGGIDLLVTNAGGPPPGGFDQMTDELWQEAFTLNFLSVVRLIRATLPNMREQGYGRILNISSLSVRQPIPNLILSNAIRTGVVGLLKSLAMEVAEEGILIHNLAPGRISTTRIEQLDQALAKKQGMTVEDVRQEQASAIPLKRYGQPEEFAKTAVFLLSDACTYATGDTIFVDGGALRSI